jgi:O-palmitoleoyl-L-serine hydrolase
LPSNHRYHNVFSKVRRIFFLSFFSLSPPAQGSFTGDAAKPVMVQDKPLYYRGRRVRDAAIQYLLDPAGGGMASAADVAVSGTSAGGLAIYLHIDAIRQLIPAAIHVRGLASAGHFLEYGSTFPPQMLHLAFEQNSTGAFYPACIKDMVAQSMPAEACIFPEHFSHYIQTPVFALQSRFDTWQLEHISHVPSANATAVEAYGEVIQRRMGPLIAAANMSARRIPVGRGGHGSLSSSRMGAPPPHAVWLSACLTHGLAQTSHWTVAEIDGVHEWEAFQRWFNGSMDGQRRDWIDCTSYNCEHTCP